MKNLAFMIIVAIVSMSMISVTRADGFTSSKKVIKVTLERAVFVPGLVKAIYEQVDRSMLKEELEIYAPKVIYNGNIYQVTGTYEQWNLFFNRIWKSKTDSNKVKLGTN